MKPNTLKIDDVEYIRADSVQQPVKLGSEVIVRTYSAGVHIGSIIERAGQEIKLGNARRLWSWQGALTLNEVSSLGVNRERSKISKPVQEITLLQAIEIIPVVAGVNLSTTEK